MVSGEGGPGKPLRMSDRRAETAEGVTEHISSGPRPLTTTGSPTGDEPCGPETAAGHVLSGRDPATALDATVIVMGGSNSVMTSGWTAWLRREIEKKGTHRFLNLSIGAASSLITLYRLLNENIHGRDVIVIWEYAINEDVCCLQKPDAYSIEHVQRNVRRFLVECHRRNIRVLPVLLPTQRMWEEGDEAFLNRLTGLFTRFGVRPLRADRLYRRRLQFLRRPVFEDALHISKGHTSQLLARYVADRLGDAAVPQIPANCAEAALVWHVTHDFGRGSRTMLRNSLFDVQGYLPGRFGLSHPVPKAGDALLGIAMIARLKSPGYDMRQRGWRLALSASPRGSRMVVQIKIFPLESVSGDPLVLNDARPLRFGFTASQHLLAPATFDDTPHAAASDQCTALTGLLWQSRPA